MSRAITINVPSPGDPNFNQRMAEIIEIWAGYRNNGDDRVVTVRDLSVEAGYDYGTTAPSSSTTGDKTRPGPPTNMLVAAVGMNSHRISWKNPYDEDLYYIEIWRGTVNDFSDAGTKKVAIVTIVDEIGEEMYRDLTGHQQNVTYYYWLVAVDWSRNKSDPAFVGSAAYTSNPSINDILADLQGKIEYSEISATLQSAADVSANVAGGVVFATNVNGHLSGIIHANDGTTASIYMVTNEFHVIAPAGDTYSVPFSVGTVAGVGNVVGVNGALVVDGTIKATAIEASSLTATQMKGSGFGTFTLTAGAFHINVASGIVINAGGDISLTSTSGNTGSIYLKYGAYTAGEIYANGGQFHLDAGTYSACSLWMQDYSSIYINTADGAGISVGDAFSIMEVTADSINLGGVNSANAAVAVVGTLSATLTTSCPTFQSVSGAVTVKAAATSIDFKVGSTTEMQLTAATLDLNGNTITDVASITSTSDLVINATSTALYLQYGGANAVVMTSAELRPATNKGMNSGHVSVMWNNTYSSAYYDDGGGYNDIYDDIALLHAMKSKAGADDVLDLHSLPDFVTNKADLKKKLLTDNYDMLSAKEIDEAVSKGGEMEHLVRRNVARFGDLTAGAIRQLDSKYSTEIARLEKTLSEIQKNQPKDTEVANA